MSVEVVSPREAQKRCKEEGWKLVDVRTIEEYNQGHPSGSRCIPYMIKEGGEMKPNSSFLSEVKKVFQPDDKILISCQSGRRSSMAAKVLKEAGYSHLADVDGGFSKWCSEKLDIEK
ncbi:Senescence-associated protein DIN1 [Galdieria sulphuraria]|uniref:Senescence-associated protein Din1-like protein n=1 Tax=Galdieria sulphuraria TaxID=130081 RepID=M2VT86_GALSU|nr:senescence-associated protein Din1-like protein [Galdieria sulphuraria]EME26386.1 senescence-associated protein Din1-like protein [Galdieria sulphuraria]GJD08062.1 Senescence-associated protein DIN1 [Galdieria sulphuraria]|eukprot:XP_005702906.1 senescence-associated protein Din1-like protein [Galdieria sulphuraria]